MLSLRKWSGAASYASEEISKESGGDRQALTKNPHVRAALKQLEDELRAEGRGVLPPLATANDQPPVPPIPPNPHVAAGKAHLKRLEAENAALKTKIMELRAQNERYRLMDDVLCSSGRLPR